MKASRIARSIAIGLITTASAALLSGTAYAQLASCADLLAVPPLAGNPAVFSATSEEATTGAPPRAYCDVRVVWRDPALRGAAGGYADPPDAQNNYQHIQVRVALPVNSNTGDAAWGGRLIVSATGGHSSGIPGLTGFVAMNPAAMGAGTDSGHGTTDSYSGTNWGVVPGVSLNEGKIKDWTGGRANNVATRLAKQLAQAYYGAPVQRTYWTGFSGGGNMGWAQALFYPEEFDGYLINSPANHWQKFRLADVWDETVRKKLVQDGGNVTGGQMTAVVNAARAACDPLDGVTDGILADPRRCTWSATANICGAATAPAAPNCLTAKQAAGVNRMYDGPRNSYGKRIWHPYDHGINLGTGTSPGTAGVIQGGNNSVRWAMYSTDFDVNLNLYQDQQSINWAAAAGVDVSQAITYENVARLVSEKTGDFTDADYEKMLNVARDRGAKIIVTHGTADGAIQWRNAADMYMRTATHFGNGTRDYGTVYPWYRLFLVPGLGHAPVNMLAQVIDWVENGVVPDRFERTTGFRVLCPYPQEAMYVGGPGGDTTDPANFVCGGNLESNTTALCAMVKTVYKGENGPVTNTLDIGVDPRTCQTPRPAAPAPAGR